MQQEQPPALASTVQPAPEGQLKPAMGLMPTSLPAPAAPASNQITMHNPRPVPPAAEGHSSRHGSSPTSAAIGPIKLPAALPKHQQGTHLPGASLGSKQANSSNPASSSSPGGSKLVSHYKGNMAAIQEEDESAGLTAAAKHAKQRQASQCEI